MTCFFCLISHHCLCSAYFFFFNYPAPTDIYTLSLHDALPISAPPPKPGLRGSTSADGPGPADPATPSVRPAPEPWQSSARLGVDWYGGQRRSPKPCRRCDSAAETWPGVPARPLRNATATAVDTKCTPFQ